MLGCCTVYSQRLSFGSLSENANKNNAYSGGFHRRAERDALKSGI